MSRQATKACGNRYYEARMRAARYNPDFAIRRTATEYLPGVEEDSLKKYELDITRPPNDVIALMADAYNAPELRAWYCANECPLGKDCEEIPEMPPERAVIRLNNAVKDMREAISAVESVMEDGKVNDGEDEMLGAAKEQLVKTKNRITEVLAAIAKAERTGDFK